jgi:tetratricopeptide (TPR) repeat protein
MSYITRLLSCLVFLNAAAAVQQPFTWVGQKVVTKYQYPVKVGNQIIEDGSRHEIFTVTRTEGDWLWVVSGSIEGWLPVSQVIRFDQALDFYTNEIHSNPANAAAYSSRGVIWDDKKEYDIALADYNEAIRLNPTNAVVYNNRGGIWIIKKDYEKAVADYNEAIRLDPRYVLAYIGRGQAWNNKKQYDKAIADYNEAIRLDPKYADSYSDRGAAWGAKKEYDKAIADFSEAVRLDPKNGSAFNNRGLAWRYKKEYDKAIADYSEAIRIDPNFASAYSSVAWLWATCPDARFRDGKKAVESATAACKFSEWNDANHLDTLAAAYAEAGDFDKAAEWQEKANKLYTDPDDKKKGEERIKLYRDKKPYRDLDK